jgi:pimeloyl-ACP methyl ester carboxylesterase
VRAADLDVERLGEGPPILFVPGSVVGADLTWRRQRELSRSWTLIFPNRPGFGDSPPLPRNDFELEAPLFAELLGDGAHLVPLRRQLRPRDARRAAGASAPRRRAGDARAPALGG